MVSVAYGVAEKALWITFPNNAYANRTESHSSLYGKHLYRALPFSGKKGAHAGHTKKGTLCYDRDISDSAGVLGTPGRRFKSCCPDQLKASDIKGISGYRADMQQATKVNKRPGQTRNIPLDQHTEGAHS